MKLFVTAAQEAAWRLEMEQAALQKYLVMAEHDHARLRGEIERLREDRREELARLADPAAPFVAHLQAEVAHWRMLFQAEKQRADLSVDQRLAERGLGPVTLPTRPLQPEAMPQTLEELLRNTELGAIGGEVER